LPRTPALKVHAKALDVRDPFERTPGSVKFAAGTKRAPVVDLGLLAALGFK